MAIFDIVVLGTIWPMTVVVSVFLGVRLWVRHDYLYSIWWDDFLLTISWLTALAYTVIMTMTITISSLDWLSVSSTVACTISFALCKSAFALSLVRVLEGPHLIVLWTVFAFINISAVFQVISSFAPLCSGGAFKQRLYHFDGPCWPQDIPIGASYAFYALCVICDFILAFMPWIVLGKLELGKKEKIGAAVAMSLGAFTGVVALIRILTYAILQNRPEFPALLQYSFLLNLFESHTGIIAQCIPVLRVFVRDSRLPDRDVNTAVELASVEEETPGIRRDGLRSPNKNKKDDLRSATTEETWSRSRDDPDAGGETEFETYQLPSGRIIRRERNTGITDELVEGPTSGTTNRLDRTQNNDTS